MMIIMRRRMRMRMRMMRRRRRRRGFASFSPIIIIFPCVFFVKNRISIKIISAEPKAGIDQHK